LLIVRDADLANKPKHIKAIILASAGRNFVSGTSRDGAGGVSAAWADDVARKANAGWGKFNYDCGFAEIWGGPIIPLQAGFQTRVAIVWSANPNHSEYFMRPSTNLNYKVNDPNGVSVSSFGNSKDNTFEWIEFTAPLAGNYQIFIERGHCNNPVNAVAYAYWQFI
jgi:hypothetical protein